MLLCCLNELKEGRTAAPGYRILSDEMKGGVLRHARPVRRDAESTLPCLLGWRKRQ